MYEIKQDMPLPAYGISKGNRGRPRHSRHSMLRATALLLKPGQSFQVPCASENDKVATMRALKRFRLEAGLKLAIMSVGPTSFGVWGQ